MYQGCTVTKTSHLPIRYFLALLWVHPILHVSRIRVNGLILIVLLQIQSLETMVLRGLLTKIWGVSQHYEALLCFRKWRHKGIMLQSNFTVFLLFAVTDLVCKLCAAVQELSLWPTFRATWNPMRGLLIPGNLMSNIHIRNAWGIAFLVSLLLKEEAGKERSSGLASKGRRTYHLPSALGQKIEISFFFLSFFLSFSLFLSFFIVS